MKNHKVAPGETLYRIANLYGVTIQQIINSNKQLTLIKIGQSVKIPQTEPRMFHIVRDGETLWRISQNYKVNLHELIGVNLKAGITLLIPLSEKVVKAEKADQKTNSSDSVSSSGSSRSFPDVNLPSLNINMPDLPIQTVIVNGLYVVYEIKISFLGKVTADFGSRVTLMPDKVKISGIQSELASHLASTLEFDVNNKGVISVVSKITGPAGSCSIESDGTKFVFKFEALPFTTKHQEITYKGSVGYKLEVTAYPQSNKITPEPYLILPVVPKAVWKQFWKVVMKRFGVRVVAMITMSLGEGPLPVGKLISAGLTIWTALEIIYYWEDLWNAAALEEM